MEALKSELEACVNEARLSRRESDLGYMRRGLALTNTPVLDCVSDSQRNP